MNIPQTIPLNLTPKERADRLNAIHGSILYQLYPSIIQSREEVDEPVYNDEPDEELEQD
jgi:hypothetical protein